jgi:peroxiredoxin
MLKKIDKTNYVLWLAVLGAAIIIFIAAAVIVDQISHQGNSARVTTAAAPASKPVSNTKTGNKIGELAPDFALKTTDNRDIKLSDYRGKNIILNFWASWCGPCRYEMPALQSVHENWSKADVVVLAINVQDGFENARSYAKANKLTFTIPVDIPGKVAEQYGARGLPTSFIIDSDGVIKSIKIGPFINVDEIEERMAAFK